ncbi:AI-2E family transporter [Halopelagius longus]|uniref:Predicted PurR-regulated permease PerM n=1 Tax=Halopelagius longus TaxID=1236180 RepID=A0A1H1FH37_9EURY|nr:AI-2E family transporter [Halopelagius longus]SDR00265.1 Predicted PurR-regulated permease PerM [Halopelagius longus]
MIRSDIDARSVFFAILLAFFALLVAAIIKPFLSYLLGVILLAFVLYPLQRRLEPRLGDQLSAFALVAGALSATALSVAVMVMAVPTDPSRVTQTIENELARGQFQRQLESALGVELPLQSFLANAPRRVAQLLVGDISNIVSATTDVFIGLLLLVFSLYYLLKDGDRLVAWIKRMLPLEAEITEELTDEAYVTTWAVLKGHVLVAVVQGIVAGAGLFVVGISNVLFWTAVMMFLALLPIVGVAAVLGPAALYLFLDGRLLAAGFLVAYGLTAVALVDDYLRAYVVDRGSSLHSAVILVGVFGGVYAFGVMGLFYGPIVIGLFKRLVQLFNEHYVETAETRTRAE